MWRTILVRTDFSTEPSCCVSQVDATIEHTRQWPSPPGCATRSAHVQPFGPQTGPNVPVPGEVNVPPPPKTPLLNKLRVKTSPKPIRYTR
jgi:hypothetical protein